MSLNYRNLNEKTRKFMLEEVQYDISNNNIYISSRILKNRLQDYIELLIQAISEYEDGWLANEIRNNQLLKSQEERRRGEKVFMAKVPVNAAEMLAEGEFNRYYTRGLCLRALNEDIKNVIVYRAKQVLNPRPESEQMVNKKLNPEALIQDLRTHQGVEPALGLPPGPNSGLSIKLP